MENGLSVSLACPFEPVDARCVVSDLSDCRYVQPKGAYCLFFVTRGSLQVRWRAASCRLEAGEALLVRGGTGEKIALVNHNEVEYYHLQFRLFGRGCAGCPHPLEVPEHAVVHPPERLTDLLRRYLAVDRRAYRSHLTLYNLVVLALYELTRSAESKELANDLEPGLEIIASRVDACIAAHYRRPIGTVEIARELRYNPDYLERAYRQERGISIREAIHRRRIREARAQLLLRRESRIAEIAALCGYNDTSYFRRVFKRVTSMTPNRYRVEAATRT